MIEKNTQLAGSISSLRFLGLNRNATAALSTFAKLSRATAGSKMLLAFLLFPTLAFGYPFDLNWNDMNGDEDGTVVYRKVSGEYQEVGIVGPNVTTFTDDPPGADGDTFCWTVRAFREGAISEPSNETCGSVPNTGPGARKGQNK